jgi:hypothetical protein
MVERRSKKLSVVIFLFAIFILLVAFTAAWIYRMYQEQTAYSESRTLATVECSKYYFDVKPESVLYEDGVLYFEIENTLGAEILSIVVKSMNEAKEVDLGGLGQGTMQPVSLPIEVVEWVLVYPTGCEGVNFQNLSFEPRT